VPCASCRKQDGQFPRLSTSLDNKSVRRVHGRIFTHNGTSSAFSTVAVGYVHCAINVALQFAMHRYTLHVDMKKITSYMFKNE
jgi:hypothetical protein